IVEVIHFLRHLAAELADFHPKHFGVGQEIDEALQVGMASVRPGEARAPLPFFAVLPGVLFIERPLAGFFACSQNRHDEPPLRVNGTRTRIMWWYTRR